MRMMCLYSQLKVAIQNTDLLNDNTEEQPLIGNQCHNNAVFDVDWVPGQMQIVSASGMQSNTIQIKLIRIFS